VSQPKATAETLAHSHIRMYTAKFLLKENLVRSGSRTKFSSSILFILSAILVFAAISCGSSSNNTGSPIANPGGPYLGNANQALSFNGSASSAPSGRTISSYAWLFGDGASGTGATTSHTYTVAGNYTATLTVTDSSGATNSSTVAVQIITAPVAKPGGPYTGKVGVAVSFNGSASTAPPGQSLGFRWGFGDGATTSGTATPTHTYTSVCTCTVTLTVTDDTAGTSVATTTATITAGPGPSGQTASPSTFFAIGPAADAATQFAYTLRSGPGSPSVLSIESFDTTTGNLRETGITAPALDSNFVPSGMITDPSRKFLYLYGGNSVLAFSISSDTGALTPSGTTATNGSTDIDNNQILIFNPSAKFAFFIRQEPNGGDATVPGSITRFSVDPYTGTLGAVETIPAQVQNPQAAAIDPSGKFLYVSGHPADPPNDAVAPAAQIAIFGIAPNTGALAPSSDSPLPVESGIVPTSLAVDSTGHFVYAAGANPIMGTAALSVFTINRSTGALAESLWSLPLGTAVSRATSIALSPSANFGYVFTIPRRDGIFVDQSVPLFKWDAQTGEPEFANAVISTSAIADPSAPSAGNLLLLSPGQLNAADSTTNSNTVFLFCTSWPGKPVYVYPMNANSGLFN
jgi:PKD repeat protein